jgi:hypothetical protein
MSAEARTENEESLRIIVHQLGICHHGRAQRRLMFAGRSFTKRFPFSFGTQKTKAGQSMFTLCRSIEFLKLARTG